MFLNGGAAGALGEGVRVLCAVLSTHTGGFGTPTVVHLDGQLPQMVAHWQRCGIRFDGILVGYLGSLEAVELTRKAVTGSAAESALMEFW